MMPGNDQRLSLPNLRFVIRAALVMASLLGPSMLQALPQGVDQRDNPILLIGPAYEHPAIHRYLPGSKRTVLSPALMKSSGEITPLGEESFTTPDAWDRFIKEAQESSELKLATLTPDLVRDSHGIIQMAVITSESPFTASCILTPGFLRHFSAIFGPEILIAIPTRNKIYVFPKLANHLAAMTETIRDDYLISPIPASTELFELSNTGLHAVGSLNPDDE